MLEESTVYQDIFQKGERKVALRQLERRFGKLSPSARQKIDLLVAEQLEALCDALLDFQSQRDLTQWLKQHKPGS